MAIVKSIVPNQKGLVFFIHGFLSSCSRPHCKFLSEIYQRKGFSVIMINTTHSLEEGDGKPELATITNFLNDLEDIIEWSKTQEFYQEPFALLGSSLGGICVFLYAERNPEKINSIINTAPVISGDLSVKCKSEEEIKEWKEKKYKEYKLRNGRIFKVPWSHVQDRLKYDALKEANKLTMPVMIFVGDKDHITPLEHQKMMIDKILGKKKLVVFDDTSHSEIGAEKNLERLKKEIDNWLEVIK